MSSALPTDSAWSKEVDNFGLGPYDGTSDSSTLKGEDDEAREPSGETLPDGGAKEDPGLEYYLSYPQEQTVWNKHSTGFLPGDLDRPPRGHNPSSDTLEDVLPTSGSADSVVGGNGKDEDKDTEVSYSHLPSGNLPSARSDYYDRTVLGSRSFDSIYPDEDSGAYAGELDEDGSSLPGVEKNEVSMGDFLNALGNPWQGFVHEDISGPNGFPSEDFQENADFSRPDGLGELIASDDISIALLRSGDNMGSRVSTDIKLVVGLTKDFIKKFGKKNIVRRHVLAFLQDAGLPQYLASDIVRCLKHQHSVVIPDVMDTFPLAKIASAGRSDLGSVYRSLAELQARHSDDPEVLSTLGRCAAVVSGIMADLDRFEVKNG